ncbi:hypothetical protein [Pseudomonas sp. 22 E 5]|uniref:Uncharacterized protein n=1 Tax=Pseudomonas asgharzadehiana TaxID=2842349 RepID=A0ABX8P653_9PSED|nr:hypothetical protein [Pseudomonas asgharzadehiana]QXH68974.1 hypothetical protein KSS96_08575 [Pseudomonas asgharzadehiana]CRM86329.1 hypothetical protein [Pseudomonas sp. 22 E 5]
MYKIRALVVTVVLGVIGSLIAAYILDGTVWGFIKSTFGFLFFSVTVPLSVWFCSLMVTAILFFLLGRKRSINSAGVDFVGQKRSGDISHGAPAKGLGLESESEKKNDDYKLAKLIMAKISSGAFLRDDDIVRKCEGVPASEVLQVIAHLVHIEAVHYERGYLRKSLKGDELLKSDFFESIKN